MSKTNQYILSPVKYTNINNRKRFWYFIEKPFEDVILAILNPLRLFPLLFALWPNPKNFKFSKKKFPFPTTSSVRKVFWHFFVFSEIWFLLSLQKKFRFILKKTVFLYQEKSCARQSLDFCWTFLQMADRKWRIKLKTNF